ncbi:OstA-like protein [Flavisolibacter nicotianae]|uniref:OstA-like protein n=1 Tax=Flavisolibacter nicotianae TaxID=2364882 RepID=UPI000EB1583B|nr:OstA-like protein [Flavisolibacter nicotianae]
MNCKHFSVFFFFLLSSFFGFGQAVPGDTVSSVQILNAKNLQVRNLPNGTQLQILAGNVRLKQGTTLFTTDSCVLNATEKTFSAFGHVYINDSDTAKVWSNTLRYQYDRKYAYLNGNVRLTDGQGTLTTPALEYDVARRIGTYTNGGKVVNKRTTVTSREGTYYADIHDIYFKQNVVMKDPGYTVLSDSILYNTETRIARFIAATTIRDSSGRVIKTSEGYYDLQAGKADFTQRTTIVDKSLTVVGDRIASDDETGIIQIEGRGVLIDTAKGINILADRIFANKKTEAFLATNKPLMIIRQEKDSIYIAADTLFSARLSDLFVDTTKKARKPNPKDSTNRYFEAYRNVRVFSDSVQSVSDSLFYSFKDSVFRLYQNPVVWSKRSQITGDTILLYTKNKKPQYVKAWENSFMISEVQQGVYNQIKGTRMDGFFKEGVLDSVRTKGAAESVYFIQDKDSAFTSVNQTQSDAIDLYFLKGDLQKVVLRSSVNGTVTPIKQTDPQKSRLANFRWLEARRPKTKYELFE